MKKLFKTLTIVLFLSIPFCSYEQYQSSVNNVLRQQSYRNFINWSNQQSMRHYYFNSASASMSFKITLFMKDSTIISFTSPIKYDSTVNKYYVVKENKKLSKNDSGRYTKIFPDQTSSISCSNNIIESSSGLSGDSCWLFLSASGKIRLFSATPDPETAGFFLVGMQMQDSSYESFDTSKLKLYIQENPKAMKSFKKENYIKAVEKYNEDEYLKTVKEIDKRKEE